METFIHDFLEFSKGQYIVFQLIPRGTEQPQRHPRANVEVISVTESRGPLKKIASLLRLVWRGSRAKAGDQVFFVHKPELVPMIKVFAPTQPVTLIVHNDFRKQLATAPPVLRYAKRLAVTMMEWIVRTMCKRVGLFGRLSANRYSSRGNEVIELRAFFNEKIFPPPGDPSAKRAGIIWAGRLTKVKNPQLALRVFAQIANEVEDTLLVIGDGPLLGRLKKLSKHLGLENRVQFHPHLSRGELGLYFRRARVFLQTSLSEGAPRTLLEAAASGATVISTEEGDPEGWAHVRLPLPNEASGYSEFAEELKKAVKNGELRRTNLSQLPNASTEVPRVETALELNRPTSL